MVRTELGRVVYKRKKHHLEQSDVSRIQLKFAKETSFHSLNQATKKTFGEIARTFVLELGEALGGMEDWAGVCLAFVDGYEAEIQALLDKGAAGPKAKVMYERRLGEGVIRILERTINTIEGS